MTSIEIPEDPLKEYVIVFAGGNTFIGRIDGPPDHELLNLTDANQVFTIMAQGPSGEIAGIKQQILPILLQRSLRDISVRPDAIVSLSDLDFEDRKRYANSICEANRIRSQLSEGPRLIEVAGPAALSPNGAGGRRTS